MRIPESMTAEEAATLGVGVSTVGQGLYQSLGLPLPTSPSKKQIPLLIYGGSTATGTLAIQYAKLYVLLCLLQSCCTAMLTGHFEDLDSRSL